MCTRGAATASLVAALPLLFLVPSHPAAQGFGPAAVIDVLHLRDDAIEFLSSWKLREIVKRYSDFIDHPVFRNIPTDIVPDDPPVIRVLTDESAQGRFEGELSRFAVTGLDLLAPSG